VALHDIGWAEPDRREADSANALCARRGMQEGFATPGKAGRHPARRLFDD